MSLGTAVLLFFACCALGVIGIVFLVRWLYRIAKRNPNAAKVYHVLTAITGCILVSTVAAICFLLPRPLSTLPQETHENYPIVRSGNDFWVLAKPMNGPIGLARFNFSERKYHWLASFEEERSHNIFMHSFATDGHRMAFTFDGEDNYLVVFSGDSLLLSESSEHYTFVSYDKATQHFLVGKQLWPEELEFSSYDRSFRLLQRDTFVENKESKTFSFGPNELQYIGGTWYANCDQQTYRLRFSNDTCYYVPYSNGDESLFVLDGSLDHRAHGKIITDNGFVLTGLPDLKDDNSVFDPGAWYELEGEKRTWQYMTGQHGQREFKYHRWLANDRFLLTETGTADYHFRTYKISYHGKGESEFRVLDIPSLPYNDEMIVTWKDSIGIFYKGFSTYAVFDLVTGDRLDKTGVFSSLHEIVNDETQELFILAGCALFLCWMLLLFILRMKKSATPSKAWAGLVSLILFFFILLPGIAILIGTWK